jgi:hypothetical protein
MAAVETAAPKKERKRRIKPAGEVKFVLPEGAMLTWAKKQAEDDARTLEGFIHKTLIDAHKHATATKAS